MNFEAIGRRLKEARTGNTKLNQREAGQALGIESANSAASYINQAEKGQKTFSNARLREFADLYKVDIVWLEHGIDMSRPSASIPVWGIVNDDSLMISPALGLETPEENTYPDPSVFLMDTEAHADWWAVSIETDTKDAAVLRGDIITFRPATAAPDDALVGIVDPDRSRVMVGHLGSIRGRRMFAPLGKNGQPVMLGEGWKVCCKATKLQRSLP